MIGIPAGDCQKAVDVHAVMSEINGQGNICFKKLIKSLPKGELKILRSRKDLIARVADISNMGPVQIREYMLEHFGMVAETCMNHDWWVEIEGIRDRVPKWSRAVHEGHYLGETEFMDWGQRRLMLEVRVNLNMARIRELREERAEKQRKAVEAQKAAVGYYELAGFGHCGA
jgi:hypothetical protein